VTSDQLGTDSLVCPSGLDPAASFEQAVLAWLDDRGPLTPSALAALEQVRPQSMGQTLDAVARRGWVTRSAHPDDRRQVLIALTDADCATFDPLFKVHPALRSAADVDAIRRGLADGTIDAIATDHAPHAAETKEKPFEEAPPGMLGLETALALSLTELDVPIEQVLGLLSWRPAAIAGLSDAHGGPIAPGRPAHLCVIDPSHEWVVDPAGLASRARNTPYAGRKLRGTVRHTLLRGEVVVRDGEAQR